MKKQIDCEEINKWNNFVNNTNSLPLPTLCMKDCVGSRGEAMGACSLSFLSKENNAF